MNKPEPLEQDQLEDLQKGGEIFLYHIPYINRTRLIVVTADAVHFMIPAILLTGHSKGWPYTGIGNEKAIYFAEIINDGYWGKIVSQLAVGDTLTFQFNECGRTTWNSYNKGVVFDELYLHVFTRPDHDGLSFRVETDLNRTMAIEYVPQLEHVLSVDRLVHALSPEKTHSAVGLIGDQLESAICTAFRQRHNHNG